MTRGKRGSSSRSATSRGQISLGGRRVADADWTLDMRRDYIDASAFGTSKLYQVGTPEVHGSFSAPFDPDAANPFFPALDDDRMIPVSFYVPKEITRLHGLVLDLLGRERPMHCYATGEMHDVKIVSNGRYTKGEVTTSAMTINLDPGTLPHVYRVRLERKLADARYRLWDRFLRPTIVIDQDEWQADEYEAHEEELHYAAMERAELAEAYGPEVDDEA